MQYFCTAYIFPDGRVMVNGDGETDNLERWLHPDERKRAKKVRLQFEDGESSELYAVVNQ